MWVTNPVPLCGDIKIEFYNKTMMKQKVSKLNKLVQRKKLFFL